MDFEPGLALIATAILEVPVDVHEAGLVMSSVDGLSPSTAGSTVAF